MASAWPSRNSTLVICASAADRCARAIIAGVMSMPMTRPVGPTRPAAKKASIPPPLPMSSTTSPGLSDASAVGFPQPSEMAAASAGTAASWSPL